MSLPSLPAYGTPNWYGFMGDLHEWIGTGLRLRDVYQPEDYGTVDPTGVANSSAAIQAAIDAAAASPTGGVVNLGPGVFKIDTTLNMSNINLFRGVTLKGAGRFRTTLVGGESGFGFIELVGSNRVTVEGMTLSPLADIAAGMTRGATPSLAYAILAGRKAGNASSGFHQFRDLVISGAFSVAGIFALSSEINSYRELQCRVFGGGHGVLLARENTYGVTAKHTALTTTSPLTSGNGQNTMDHVEIWCTVANKHALVLEFVQTFVANSLYLYTEESTAQILMAKECHGAVFNGLQQESGVSAAPFGFYFSATEVGGRLPDFRGVEVNGSRVGSIYAEDGTRISDMRVEGSEWVMPTTYQVDVDTLVSSLVRQDTRVTQVNTVASPAYRVRTMSASNQWLPEDVATSSALPSAAYRGVGARMYHRALKKPVWSDGSTWRDAVGTSVTGEPLLSDLGVSAYRALGLRQLRTGATLAIKVRRSSDNATQDIGFTSGGLDTTALLAFVGANSGFIETWYDQSGNGRNMTQTTQAQQARIVNAGVLDTLNSRPAAVFSSSRYVDTTNVGLYSAGASSLLSVRSHDAPGYAGFSGESGGSGRYFGDVVTDTYASWFGVYDIAGVQWVSGGLAKSYAAGVAKQVSFVDTGTRLASWMDGQANNNPVTYSRSGHTVTNTSFTLGAVNSTGSWPYVGHFAEAVWFTAALLTIDRQAGESNQRSYYATA